eukprot:1159261-Pelagomonas_calceolata.AAC.5
MSGSCRFLHSPPQKLMPTPWDEQSVQPADSRHYAESFFIHGGCTKSAKSHGCARQRTLKAMDYARHGRIPDSVMRLAGAGTGRGCRASIWGRKRDRMRVGDKKCRLQLEVGNRDMTRVEDTKCRRRIGAGTE